MKVSIVIPVYNAEKFIGKLLESVEEQTYKNYEVVIINDGSTDNSLEVITRFSCKNDKIKCITVKNGGPGLARKRGFEEATGDLLFFIDSDDYIPNNKALENIVKIYKESKFDILFFDFIRKCNEVESIANGLGAFNLKEGKHEIDFFNKKDVAGALWCKIFVKDKMNTEYFCQYNNYEDFYTTYRYLENCTNFYYTKEICYFANRDNNDSISKIINSQKISNTVTLLKKIYDESKYKDALSIIVYDYYVVIRRKLDSVTRDQNIIKDEEKIKELKPFFNLIKLIKMRQKLRRCLIYIYYNIKDIFIRGKNGK
ncbi:MAG: glycosyltransferase family 2 protein [Clostridia bacterium]|nr:glycosyltransferase family 2 protein [Clostridia bacterium]